MSTALFTPGKGSYWRPTPEEILQLPRPLRNTAREIWDAILHTLNTGEVATTELVTDAVLADHSGWSKRTIQFGLWILEKVCKVIKRHRRHGRRIITILVRLRGSNEPTSPQTPQRSFEQTSTDRGSSSSSLPPTPPQTQETNQPPSPKLVARARALIPTVTAERIAVTVATYGEDWVARALDQVEKRNQNPDKLPVQSWRYVLGILRNWKDHDGGPPAPEPHQPATTPTKPAGPTEEEKRQQAQDQQRQRIWDALSDEQRREIRDEVERQNPTLKKWENLTLAQCLNRVPELDPAPATTADPTLEDPRAP